MAATGNEPFDFASCQERRLGGCSRRDTGGSHAALPSSFFVLNTTLLYRCVTTFLLNVKAMPGLRFGTALQCNCSIDWQAMNGSPLSDTGA